MPQNNSVQNMMDDLGGDQIEPKKQDNQVEALQPRYSGHQAKTSNNNLMDDLGGDVLSSYKPNTVQSNNQQQPVQSTSAQPEDTLLNRAKLSLQRDWAEAGQKAKQIQTGDLGILGTIGQSLHPLTAVRAALQPFITNPSEAAKSLEYGEDAHKVESMTNQLNQMKNVKFMSDPVEWAREAIGNNVLDTLGLAPMALNPLSQASTAVKVGEKVLPAVAKGVAEMGAVGATGIAGSAAGRAAGQMALNPITNAQDPKYYSRENQAQLSKLSGISDIGGVLAGTGGALAAKPVGAWMQEAFQPNKYEANKQLGLASKDTSPGHINQVLDTQTTQASTMLDTAKSLGLPTEHLPNNPNAFKSQDIQGLQKTIADSPIASAYQQTLENMNTGARVGDNSIAELKNVVSNPEASMQIKSNVQSLLDKAEQHNDKIAAYEVQQENKVKNAIISEDSPSSIKEFLKMDNPEYRQQEIQQQNIDTHSNIQNAMAEQQKALSPMYEGLNKGVSEQSRDKINSTIGDIMHKLTDPNNPEAIGTLNLFEKGSMPLNFTLSQLKGKNYGEGEGQFSLLHAESLLGGLKEIVRRPELGNTETSIPKMTANHMIQQLEPVIKQAKQEAITNYLVDNKGLQPEEATQLYNQVNNIYPDMAANRVRYKDTWKPKFTLAQGNEIVAHPKMETYHKDITSDLPGIMNFGSNLSNVNTKVKDLVQSPLYQKAFGGFEEGSTATDLDKSMLHMNKSMQNTFSNSIKEGVMPETVNPAQVQQLGQLMNYSNAKINSDKQALSQRPDVAKVLINNEGGQQRPATYESILNKFVGDKPIAPQTAKATLDYLKSHDEQGYSRLMSQADDYFTSGVANLVMKNDADAGSKVIRLANQLKDKFGVDADPILMKSMENIGAGIGKASPDVKKSAIDGLKSLVGNIGTKEADISKSNQIKSLGETLGIGSAKLADTSSAINQYQHKMYNRAMQDTSFVPNVSKIRILKTGLDVIGRMLTGGVTKDKMDKVLGDTLQSRANFDAAQAKIKEKNQAKMRQTIYNVLGGAAAGNVSSEQLDQR